MNQFAGNYNFVIANAYISCNIERGISGNTLPLLLPVIKVVVLLAMVGGMQIMNEVLLITNGGPAGATNVVMLHIYKMYFAPAGKPELGYASALGVITSVVLGIITFIYV